MDLHAELWRDLYLQILEQTALGNQSSSITPQDQEQIASNFGLSIKISTSRVYWQFTKLPFGGPVLMVTLGHTIVITVAAATSLWMRRDLATKGHAQGQTAGRGPSGAVARLCWLSLGFSLQALRAQ